VKQFDLRKQIKLVGIELGASAHLYGIRLHFTNGVSSPYVRGASTREQAYQKITIDPTRGISDVYIS